MDRIGIEFLSVFGLHPVRFVELAADVGCRNISLALAPMFGNPLEHPTWSLREDATLRRDLVSALRDRGVSISLGEGFMVRPGAEIRNCAADLDTMCELGIRRINMFTLDPDLSRSFDQFSILVGMADAAGIETTLEFGPIFTVPDLPTALAALRHVGRPSFRLLMDTLHLARAGLGPGDIAALDPDQIGYAQLCDAPLAFTSSSYMNEASFQRMVPGTGELPLDAVVGALPQSIVIGLEVPMLSEAQAGVDLHTLVGRCVEATRNMLVRVGR